MYLVSQSFTIENTVDIFRPDSDSFKGKGTVIKEIIEDRLEDMHISIIDIFTLTWGERRGKD